MEFLEIAWRGRWYDEEIELRDRLLRAPLGLVFTEHDLEEEAMQWHFGMLDQSQLIACAVVVPLEEDRVKLRQMAVDETRQRGGIGSRLIQGIEQEMLRRGVAAIELHARDHAVGFYERLGYRKQGDEFMEVTIPHWKMTKPLAASI